MPAARCYPIVCSFQGRIYVFGGSPGMWSSALKTVYVYDPQSNSWDQKKDMPYAVGYSGVAVAGDMIYLIGGTMSASTPPLATVMAYDASSDNWTLKTEMPTARYGLAACVVDGRIYAIGGTTEKWETVSYKHVEVYDPTTDTWARKADLPNGRWGLFADVVDGWIYAIGGRSGSYSSSTNEAYNPDTDTWTSKSPMQKPRTGLAGCILNNRIYVTGGHQGPPIVMHTSLEKYEPAATEVNEKVMTQPQQFIVSQNFPNPFNSSTKIHYYLHEPNHIRLEITNIKGELVQTAINEMRSAGNHVVQMNTNHLPSGIYFYKLRVGDQVTVSIKMISMR
ncbi:T9SS type A sorting domain-containing protein [bacterium]|nr:T9SS type A sorting domain-containing protein [bacterium]